MAYTLLQKKCTLISSSSAGDPGSCQVCQMVLEVTCKRPRLKRIRVILMCKTLGEECIIMLDWQKMQSIYDLSFLSFPFIHVEIWLITRIQTFSAVSAEYPKGWNSQRCRNCRFTAISAGLPGLELSIFTAISADLPALGFSVLSIFSAISADLLAPGLLEMWIFSENIFDLFGHFGRFCRRYWNTIFWQFGFTGMCRKCRIYRKFSDFGYVWEIYMSNKLCQCYISLWQGMFCQDYTLVFFTN